MEVSTCQPSFDAFQDVPKHDTEITLGTVRLKGVNYMVRYTLVFASINYLIFRGPVLGQLLRVRI